MEIVVTCEEGETKVAVVNAEANEVLNTAVLEPGQQVKVGCDYPTLGEVTPIGGAPQNAEETAEPTGSEEEAGKAGTEDPAGGTAEESAGSEAGGDAGESGAPA